MDDGQISSLAANLGGAEIIKTHISWVLIPDSEYVYKIKKPVTFSFLDFSTLGKRMHACEEEVRLNSRLAPDVYLGVVPIFSNKREGVTLSEDKSTEANEPIEYAVKMKKLDRRRMMDRLIREEGRISENDIRKLAQITAEFHSRIEKVIGSKGNTPENILNKILDLGTHRETIETACDMGEKVDKILKKSEEFVGKNRTLFEARNKEGFVRDCHGDLHCANVFLQEKIIITDCIEFNTDFRQSDVISDMAFMAMDLDAFGRADLSEIYVREYSEKTKDPELRGRVNHVSDAQLLNFYKCYRANVRAKVAAIELGFGNKDAKSRIVKYLNLAEIYSKKI